MSAMKRLFQVMADKKASDIYMSVCAPINIKINGVAMPVNQTIMTADTVRELLYQVLNERQMKEFEDEMELNTAFQLEGVGAFRISAFRQKGSPAVVVRFIPNSIPALDSRFQGALRMAEIKSTAQKCTTVGVPNAPISRMLLGLRESATSVITTNCSPGSAALDEPTKPTSPPARRRSVAFSRRRRSASTARSTTSSSRSALNGFSMKS